MSIWSMFRAAPQLPAPAEALPGRDQPAYSVPDTNIVTGTALLGPWPEGTAVMYLAMGCFWGAERRLWRVDGVVGTAVGYMGGYTPHPTYEEVCSGGTGHTETVLVAYDPAQVSTYDVLKVFWENHDPTQGYRQGNDIGTQYRSAIFTTTDEQAAVARATAEAYNAVLAEQGLGEITTEIASAEGMVFYPAETYHQQYLDKNPHGYQCTSTTGVAFPAIVVE